MTRRWAAGLATCALLTTLALGDQARADAADDADAGLAALNAGDYKHAVKLFTSAIGSGRLNADDIEAAYLGRAKAYLGAGDKADAVADLKRAVRINPKDQDASDTLQAVLSDKPMPARAATEGQIINQTAGAGDRWGVLRSLAGRFYWYELPGLDPHTAYSKYAWAVQDQTLSVTMHTKTGLTEALEYQVDPLTGAIMVAANLGNTIFYGTASAVDSGSSWMTYTFFKNYPTRDTFTVQPDGSITEHDEQFRDGAWKDEGVINMIPVSPEELQADGLMKKKKTR